MCCILIILSITLGLASGETRLKRVVYGVPIEDHSAPYSVIKYIVWIGFSRDFFWDMASFNALAKWRTERQVCGGGLLTPTIIQSACHCFASYEEPAREGGNKRALRNQHTMDVVAGYSRVIPALGDKLIGIRHYILHPMCLVNKYNYNEHDFALITLADHIEVSRNIMMAPVYPMSEMGRLWQKVTFSGTVCLLIGWGRYKSRHINEKSDVLRHGWQFIRSLSDCFADFTHDVAVHSMGEFFQRYTKSCHSPIASRPSVLHTLVAKGDSGTPVTCDNVYFGLNSESHDFDHIDDLIYFQFANAEEYRQDFIHYVDSLPQRRPMDLAYPKPFLGYSLKVIHNTPPANFKVAVNSAAGNIQITFNLAVVVIELVDIVDKTP